MGSSYFPQTFISQNYSIIGPTGPTGDRGETGPTAFGPTGNTGPSITTMGICGDKLRTVFDNGQTFDTEQVLKGPTGNSVLIAGFSFTPGISIFSHQDEPGSTLYFRTIIGSTSASGRAKVTVTPINNSLYLDYTNQSSGMTIGITGPESVGSFVGYSGGTLAYIIKTNDLDDSSFASKNIIEKTRGLGFSGATSEAGATCNYITNTIFGYFDTDTPPVYRTFDCKLLKINPDCIANNSVDLTIKNNVFIANMKGSPTQVELGYAASSNASAITLVLLGASNGPPASSQTEKRFYLSDSLGQLKWPFNVEPCFSGTGGTDVYHFYNLGGLDWYGSVGSMSNLPAFYSCPNGKYTPVPNAFLGACSFADGTSGGACFYETQDQCLSRGASAFWHGGLTCGDNPNTGTGACCIGFLASGNPEDSYVCVNGVTCIDCLSRRVRDPNGITYNGILYTYSGNGITCSSMSCGSNSGACCKDGNCSFITRAACDEILGDFLGEMLTCQGVTCEIGACWNCSQNTSQGCIYEALCKGTGVTWIRGDCVINPCLGETGSCCIQTDLGITCIDGVTEGFCNATGGDFISGLTCGQTPCAQALAYETRHPLKYVDLELLGKKSSFTPNAESYADYMAPDSNSPDEPYLIYYDNFGYASEEEILCGLKTQRQKIKYKMYIYKYNLKNNDNKYCQSESPCPQVYSEAVIFDIPGANCWGPRIEEDGTHNDIKKDGEFYPHWRDEGFWKRTYEGQESVSDLSFNTFNYCPSFLYNIDAIFDEKSKFSPNGGFRRNWGLYNTMRIMSADNAGYVGLPSELGSIDHKRFPNNPGGTPTSICPPGVPVCVCKPRMWTVSRLIDKLNREVPVPENSSSWFLPSYEEMAFIANNIGDINGQLLGISGDILNLVYWTSTATFLFDSDEGIKATEDGLTDIGRAAWGFDFINPENPKSLKLNRLDLKSVRAIRLERIDDEGNVLPSPSPNSEEYKIWRMPRLKSVTDLLGNTC